MWNASAQPSAFFAEAVVRPVVGAAVALEPIRVLDEESVAMSAASFRLRSLKPVIFSSSHLPLLPELQRRH